MLSKIRLLGLAVLVFSLVGSWAQDTTTQPKTKTFDEVVPEDALLFISIASVQDVSNKLKEGELGRIANEEEVKTYLETVFERITENGPTKTEVELMELLKDKLFSSMQGEIAAYIGSVDFSQKDPKPQSMGILVDAGEKSADLDDLMKTFLKHTEADVEKSTFMCRGIEVTKLVSTQEEEDYAGYIANVGKVYFIIGSQDDDGIKTLIDNLRSKEPRKIVATNPDYRSAREKHRDSDLFVWFGTGFVKDLIKEKKLPDADEEDLEKVEKALEELGLFGLRSISMSVAIGMDDIKMRWYLNTDSEPRGLLKILSNAVDPYLPGYIPQESATVFSGNVDWQLIWDIIEKMMDIFQATGPGGEELDIRALLEEQLGFDIKEGLFDVVDNSFVGFEVVDKPIKSGASRSCWFFKLKDEDKMKDTVEKFTEAVNSRMPFISDEEYMGKKIYKFSPPLPGAQIEIDFCVTNGLFLIGVPDALKETIRRFGKESKSIFDTEGYKTLAKNLPSKYAFAGYSSAEAYEYAMVDAKEKLANKLQMLAMFGGEHAKDLIDILSFDSLPSAEVISRHIFGGIGYLTVIDKGLFAEGILQFKKAEK